MCMYALFIYIYSYNTNASTSKQASKQMRTRAERIANDTFFSTKRAKKSYLSFAYVNKTTTTTTTTAATATIATRKIEMKKTNEYRERQTNRQIDR